MEVGFAEIGMSSWSLDYGRYWPKVLCALGEPCLAMPEMTRIARERLRLWPRPDGASLYQAAVEIALCVPLLADGSADRPRAGDQVLVQTDAGPAVGTVVRSVPEVLERRRPPGDSAHRVIRVATHEDILARDWPS